MIKLPKFKHLLVSWIVINYIILWLMLLFPKNNIWSFILIFFFSYFLALPIAGIYYFAKGKQNPYDKFVDSHNKEVIKYFKNLKIIRNNKANIKLEIQQKYIDDTNLAMYEAFNNKVDKAIKGELK